MTFVIASPDVRCLVSSAGVITRRTLEPTWSVVSCIIDSTVRNASSNGTSDRCRVSEPFTSEP